MAEAGRPTDLIDKYKKLKLLVSIGKQQLLKRQKPYFRNNATKNIKINGDCVICNESRIVETCHIIPVYICRDTKGLEYLASSKDNCLRLCKNHHWLFDNRLLRDDELELIYKEKKKFIETVLLDLANSVVKENKLAKISNSDITNLSKFNKWIEWVSRVFYIKN